MAQTSTIPTADQLISLALSKGATHAAMIDPKTIRTLPEFQAICAQNTCGSYNTNWACPPACGSSSECQARLNSYCHGILVQTKVDLEDSFDLEGMEEGSRMHEKMFRRLWAALRGYPFQRLLAMSAGGCKICPQCTYPNEPCRFPEQLAHPIEGYGVNVAKLCQSAGLKYVYGPNTVAYAALFVYDL